ncbi:hypothetical protein SAMN05428947_103201 [Mucilaginibacter sp. OK283]|jgi:hypothetical protein|nr:hypothetical protein SAMN05428947_103201 [Mucilaginibacter sp. OK283]
MRYEKQANCFGISYFNKSFENTVAAYANYYRYKKVVHVLLVKFDDKKYLKYLK